ncbi:dolichol-phosphate mannosyltransferase [Glaciihabitans tibetensis]|uniref:Dolichol-phosphate mannosyltransferase n=1 Tax=Glaciihabitans tibetensis TaxID=1266600 RepID=A0A2T0VFD4_9MICO|nr:glycosyltransferase family 2 protein [Glaciihabitans tibetensis]PRY68905.1 dolichol-phosphate mannosyltransferase [Glaciihabitans tibetensis]
MSSADGSAPLRSSDGWQVPAHTTVEFAARANDYCVVVFVLNEGDKVRQQLIRMRDLHSDVDVIVADGGSTDGSLSHDFLRQAGVNSLLVKTGAGKLSAQMRMAFSWAVDRGYLGVIVIDGNGKDDVSAIPEFRRLLAAGFDHVQGSRFIPGGRAINTPLSRHIGLKVLHAPLISLASRRVHTDTTNGFRGYSARLLADPTVAVFRDVFSTYELHYHLAIESSRDARFKTVETPVTREYPKGVKTPTKISPVRGNARILRILFSAALGRYRLRPEKDEK